MDARLRSPFGQTGHQKHLPHCPRSPGLPPPPWHQLAQNNNLLHFHSADSKLADALPWVMSQNRVHYTLHYQDNFLFVGSADTSSCADQLQHSFSYMYLSKLEGTSGTRQSTNPVNSCNIPWHLHRHHNNASLAPRP